MTGRRLLAAAAAVGGLTVLGALAACGSAAPGQPSSPSVSNASTSSSAATRTAPTTSAAPSTSDPHTGTVPPAPPAAVTTSPPVRIEVPSIGVSSSLQALGLLSNGDLQSPSQWQVAGWYAQGVLPGDPGPAVIAGHVDSVNGPAVFFKLKLIAIGARVSVVQKNGQRQTWIVDDLQEYPKNTFPTEAVYGPTSVPTLRLVTCTGDFDYSKRSYVDNLVVTAHLA